jgi:hypothetical protein
MLQYCGIYWFMVSELEYSLHVLVKICLSSEGHRIKHLSSFNSKFLPIYVLAFDDINLFIADFFK